MNSLATFVDPWKSPNPVTLPEGLWASTAISLGLQVTPAHATVTGRRWFGKQLLLSLSSRTLTLSRARSTGCLIRWLQPTAQGQWQEGGLQRDRTDGPEPLQPRPPGDLILWPAVKTLSTPAQRSQKLLSTLASEGR